MRGGSYRWHGPIRLRVGAALKGVRVKTIVSELSQAPKANGLLSCLAPRSRPIV